MMHRFKLYETAAFFYIIGSDISETIFRILKIDRTGHCSDLQILDDEVTYSETDILKFLDGIDAANKSTGGLKFRCAIWGLLGFIKFTGPYYMLTITKKSTIAMIGGHYIYQVDGTELIPLVTARTKAETRAAEDSRFLAILNNIDLTRYFYFSYSYDISRTLQSNISRARCELLNKNVGGVMPSDFNTMFVWNSHLLDPVMASLKAPFNWCRAIVHGYINQAAISVYGRTALITLIARRSRFFAGARFLKRGANDMGYVANDVETEQIVSDTLTTSFHSPGPQPFCSPLFTSYVQHRGSVPILWTQDNSGVTPKPPIDVNPVDPFYGVAALHMDNLFERYGAPIHVLNLVKARERTPRESKLLAEFTDAVAYLNQFLPENFKTVYIAWDMSRAAKSRDQDVIGTLEGIAESVVNSTGFFRNGDGRNTLLAVQNGIVRTNCVDCLDRTNAAQFIIGKRALGHQLRALGILRDTHLDFDTDASNLFTHMWHDHGDSIAVQYGGSQLVNTMETYRQTSQWTSHSRDMLESVRRYYNNSFLDGQRQESYNLFLGNYKFEEGKPLLWDIANDYCLHHSDPRKWPEKARRSYSHWYSDGNLKENPLPPSVSLSKDLSDQGMRILDAHWREYYRPTTLSSLSKIFLFRIKSTPKYMTAKSGNDDQDGASPFRVRADPDLDVQYRRRGKKGALLSDSREPGREFITEVSAADYSPSARGISLQRWLLPVTEKPPDAAIVMSRVKANEGVLQTEEKAIEKSNAAQWTFATAVHDSLNPSVSAQEAEDYTQYVRHPHNLPLVASSGIPADFNGEYQNYVHGNWKLDGHVSLDSEDDFSMYADLLKVGEHPLLVTEEDSRKKRYKAYRKWLMGKSFFKQQPLD